MILKNKNFWIIFLAITLALTIVFSTVKHFRDDAILLEAKQLKQDYENLEFIYGANKVELEEARKELLNQDYEKLEETYYVEVNKARNARDLFRDALRHLVSYTLYLQWLCKANGLTYAEYGLDIPLESYEISSDLWKENFEKNFNNN